MRTENDLECPTCGSGIFEITWEHFEEDLDMVRLDCECQDCGERWFDLVDREPTAVEIGEDVPIDWDGPLDSNGLIWT